MLSREGLKAKLKRYPLLVWLVSFFKNSLFKKDRPSYDGSQMSKNSTELFSKRPYLEQNLNIKLKHVLQLLEKETYNSTYFGIPTLKLPLDFWIYQELIYELQPDVIIEIGNFKGGLRWPSLTSWIISEKEGLSDWI